MANFQGVSPVGRHCATTPEEEAEQESDEGAEREQAEQEAYLADFERRHQVVNEEEPFLRRSTLLPREESRFNGKK